MGMKQDDKTMLWIMAVYFTAFVFAVVVMVWMNNQGL